MGHREKLDGDGYDAFARHWRRLLSWRPGQVSKIKRTYNKRARRDGHLTARKESADA